MRDYYIFKNEKSGGMLDEFYGMVSGESSRVVIDQFKEKLKQCERKAIQGINQIDYVLAQEELVNKTENEARAWQEKYNLRQELKEDNFRNTILNKLKKWSI